MNRRPSERRSRTISRLHVAALAASLLGCGLATPAQGQTPAPEAPVANTSSTEGSEVPRVPGLSGLLRGANAGLTIFGVHDAQTGWSTFAQPAVGWSFNDRFAVDVTIPIYFYRLSSSLLPNPRPNQLLATQRAEFGDVVVGLHAQFAPRRFLYEATLSGTIPTGDSLNGLSTGRSTFDLSNLFQHSFRMVTPTVEMGVGDSTTLADRLVTKDFTSLGPLAHFQAGASFPLPLGASFSTNAYEQLPIGDQKIYQSVKRRGTTTLVVTGRNVAEDNGFTNSLDIPLDRHTTLSAYYNRSLRLHDDVVSIGLTYVLRGYRPPREIPDDDLFNLVQDPILPPPEPPADPAPQPPPRR